MSRCLLVVESPAKSKTIAKYLGSDFTVLASFGHVRDLKHNNHAVDPDNSFAMDYEVPEKSTRHVEDLVRAARKASTIYLATDLDREGEAISWHILEIFKERGVLEGKTIHRVTFSEITQKAVREAVANPRQLSMPMVDAQQTRRALDYLVGYRLSPVLWRKVHSGLSAGRVQSPALRMIVERAEEIEKFDPKEHWTLTAQLDHPSGEFPARLQTLHGKRFEQFDLVNEDQALQAKGELEKAAHGYLTVSEISAKDRQRRPVAPFTTSTLQQEASRKLGFSTSKTMKTAQVLYEGVNLGAQGQVGLITYMRTDAVVLSEDALAGVRDFIRARYGENAMPSSPNIYKAKSKNAQEAHEAIRPTSFDRPPKAVAQYLDRDQLRLYELIWKRTVACQMIPATLKTVTIDFALPDAPGGKAVFRSTGSTVVVPGFLMVYEEGKDSKDDEDEGRRLPALNEGDTLKLLDITADQHFTEPPPYFSEALLVKTMEEYGIGRPSTYAATIQVLQTREYIKLEGKKFIPTDMGRAVSHFLTAHFDQYVDYDFTARLEDDLDAIARGESPWLPVMQQFWEPFKARIAEKMATVERDDASGNRQLGIDPVSGRPVSARLSKFGPAVQIGTKEDAEKPRWASIPEPLSMSTITLEQALALFALPRTLGKLGEHDVIANRGRFGPYVKAGEITASLPQGEDPLSVTLEKALELIEARRVFLANRVARDFGNGLKILNGQYGQFITDGKVNGKMPKDKTPEEMTEDECRAILTHDGQAPRGKKKFGKKGGFKGPQKGKKGFGGKTPKDDLP